MAKNSEKGKRVGAVKERSQVFNPSTGNYIKRDTQTGKFLDVKSDGKPFKGVKKEVVAIKSNPAISKADAKKVEIAVIEFKNSTRIVVNVPKGIAAPVAKKATSATKATPAKTKNAAPVAKKATSASKATEKKTISKTSKTSTSKKS